MKGLLIRRATLCLSAVLAFGSACAAQRRAPAPPPPPRPAMLTGTVSRVVDGDTLWLKLEGQGGPPLVVRIEGIDAPERCQPGGSEAIAALNDLALGRTVNVRVVARDEHGRTVGRVFDGEKDIGNRMVRDGQAWSMRYKFDRGPYVAEERMASSLKRGLHAGGAAMLPYDFRRQHGPCTGSAGAAQNLADRIAADGAAAFRA